MAINFIHRFELLTKKPDDYLSVQNKIASDVTCLLKSLYDFTKNSEEGKTCGDALPELIVDGFDQEQIWQELELQNNGCSKCLVEDVATLVACKNRLKFPSHDEGINKKSVTDTHADLAESEKDDMDLQEVDDMDSEDGDDMDSEEEDNIDVQKEEQEDTAERGKKGQRRKSKVLDRVTEVDDKFFKLSEMEEFLEIEENHKRGDHGDSDDSIDLFRSSDEEQDEDKNDMRYVDFFDDPHDETEMITVKKDKKNMEKTEMKKKKKKKKNKSIERTDSVENVDDGEDDSEYDDNEELEEEKEEDDDEDDDDEDEKEEEEEEVDEEAVQRDKEEFDAATKMRLLLNSDDSDNDKQVKSSLETRQERLKARIQQLEDKAMSEKPWQMKGEISASARPQNSLLEEAVEFDLTARPAPVMTEKTTLQLEDIIMQRVKDRAWDDVERKIKPVETPSEFKKKLVLDQEKSKLSLAQVYEQEFIKQREALQTDDSEKQEEEEPAEHKEVRVMMSSLFTKLDALSNFHYTPRPPVPDMKIVSNLPAITLEEVAPVATSDAALLAPEEVKGQSKGNVIGKAERTVTDKKREHRKKKAQQRKRKREQVKREQLVEKLRPGLGNKYSKEKAKRDLENVIKNSNVTQMEEKDSGKAVKSSTAFFNQLQDEVKTLIKRKTTDKDFSKNSTRPSAKRLKL